MDQAGTQDRTGRSTGLQKDQHLRIFADSWQGLLAAATLNLDASVTSCPGWNARALVAHMGAVFAWWNKWVRDRPLAASAESIADLMAERDAALPGYLAWREQGFPVERMPPGVIEFARRYQEELHARLAALPPDEPVWTFFPPDQTAGFIQRRIAHETTMHRWDAEAAQVIARPIEPLIAHDGIDEFLDAIIHVIDANRQDPRPTRGGESYHFHRMDGAGEWLVTFAVDGIHIERSSGPGDVSIGGSASDLLLFLYGRIGVDDLAVHGKIELVHRWPELAGTF